MKNTIKFLVERGQGNSRLGPNYHMSDMLEEFLKENQPKWRKIDPDNLPDGKVVVLNNDLIVTGELVHLNDKRVWIKQDETNVIATNAEFTHFIPVSELLNLETE